MVLSHAQAQVLAKFYNSHDHEVIVYWLRRGAARDRFELKPGEWEYREARRGVVMLHGGGGVRCSILCSL